MATDSRPLSPADDDPAYRFLEPPGHTLGPCRQMTCGHSDCDRRRTVAASTCRFCRQVIGWNAGYRYTASGVVHYTCWVEHLEQTRRRP